MKRVKNETTGVEEIQFGAKLISISDKVGEFKNEKKTQYRAVTLEFEKTDGETKRTTGIMYEKNYQKGIELDQTYLAVATPTDDGKVFIAVSHLVYGGQIADATDFGFDVAEVNTEIKANVAFDEQ